jgi:hypothetical protein
MKTKRTYEAEATKLGLAIDIAIEAFRSECPPEFEKKDQEHFIRCYAEWKEQCLNPEPQFKNLASLKYSINDVFTYFQESAGPTIEYFWKRITEEGLDYKREDKLAKILKRGKIRGRIEYEYVTDIIVVAQQVGLCTEEQAKQLSEMLGEFEMRQ